MRFTSILIAITLLVAGCGDKNGKVQSFTEEDLAVDPRKNFVMGVQELQTPDRRTGEVDYQAAYNFFVTSVNLNGSAKAAFNAAWVSEILNNPDDAAIYYKKAYDADPAYDSAMFSLARVYNDTGKGDLAVNLYEEFLQVQPDNMVVRNDLIVALTAAKRFDEALAQAKVILLKDPKNAAVYRNLSAMYYVQDRLGMSQLCNEKALQLDEGDAGTYNNLGVTALILEDESTAIDKFKTAIKLDSKNFEANINLGFIALNSGDYTLAAETLEKAVAANPASVDAKLGLAVALRGTKDFDRAEGLYNEVIAAAPDSEFGYFNAAILHEVYTKDFKKAETYLQQYIDTNPVGPSDPVFARMDRVKAARAEKAEKDAAEAARKKAEEERKKRNEALLTEMATVVTTYQTSFTTHAACLDPMLVEEGGMMLEQAGMVVEMKEADMAADIKMLLEGYTPLWDEAISACVSGGGGAAPEPVPEEAPAEGGGEEGGTEAPAEGG